MKKLVLLLLFFTGIVNSQIVDIPDTAFKAELVSSSAIRQVAQDFNDNWIKIDANDDGEIQVSEAQLVKSLNISQLLIFSLTGLNSFSNLEGFSIGNSLVTTLDVSALTHLKTLSCFNMQIVSNLNINSTPSLTSVTLVNLRSLVILNVNNLVNLTKLNIFGSAMGSFNANGLTSLTELFYSANQQSTNLTVNGLTNLTTINCGFNNLSTLTLSGLTALTDLNCSGNKLTNLNGLPSNLSKLNCDNNKLTAISISSLTSLTELSCGGNEFTSLNVSGLTNLIKLNCAFNKIATLSISGLPNLKTFDCSRNKELTNVTLANLPALEEFTVYGDITSSTDILSNLTTLNLSGLPNLKKLNCNYGKLTSLNLSNLPSLTELYCSSNLITDLNLTNLPNLQKLDCSRNRIENLDAGNLPSLLELNCGGGYIVGGSFNGPLLTNLNVVGLSNLKWLSCDINLLSSLDLTGLNSLETLYCGGLASGGGHLTSLNVNNLTNLKVLGCTYQALTSLDVSNLINLTSLYCSYNYISSLNLNGLINLKVLDYNYNQLANLSLINLPSLEYLSCANNQLTTLDVLDLTSLISLNCSNNLLTTLNLSGLTNLITLDFSNNQLGLANISGLSANLKELICMNNNLTSLDISGLPNLETLNCFFNQLTTLDLSGVPNLKNLDCSQNQLPDIVVNNLNNLEALSCSNNLLTTLDIFGLSHLNTLNCAYNQLTSLDLFLHHNLINLDYSYNAIPNLDVSFLPNLRYLSLSSTGTTALDLTNLVNLQSLLCDSNLLTTLDTSHSPFMNDIRCYGNNLETLFIKNGRAEEYLDYSNNPNLLYICADTAQLETLQTQLNGLGMTTTVSNSYCTFSPGGNHNTITGIAIFDKNNDGCDVTDVVNPFVRFDITDGTETGATVTNINGTYNYYTDAGNYTIAPNVENPTWFDFSPASANFNFLNNDNNISTQNFCIAATGVHNDIEVIFAPLEPARPGFDARYKIVYKNKGNQMHSGTVNLTFDDSRTDLVVSDPVADATATNSLSWNYTNLMPFENRSIILTLNLNQPGDTPALNNGDTLPFTTAITPVVSDELPDDNQYTFNQIVVGSYDPNSIECLEGATVAPSEIGKYLHYAINFENLGTFYAENIVVRSEIDPTKYDIATLQVMNTSHPSYTRITGNVVEFVFQGINLAAAAGSPPVGGHGDVLFKIKTKGNLVDNDTVLQRAGIYFDYNFPIATNDAETTFATLNNPEFEQDNTIKIYPNPTNSIINIDSDFTIESIELYDIQGRILETHFEDKTSSRLDISNKSNGIYFVKIKTDSGSKVVKIVKE